MPQDPYGFPGAPPPEETSVAAPLLATVTFVFSCLLCLGFGGFAALIGASAQEDRLIDRVGVGLLASVCAWPAAGTAFWTLLLLVGFRRPWLQAGPNVLLGVLSGTFLWAIVCCGLAGYAGITENAAGG